jgi:ribonuclease Z
MNFTLTVLGSSSALPTSSRYPTAHLLNVNERFFLIDCGEGTQMQLRKYKIRFSKINHIFISHLHGDHYFGLFGLLSSFSLLGRKAPLHLFAHDELDKIITFLFENYELGFEIVFHSLPKNKSSIIFEDNQLVISTFPMKHRIPSNGFLFREKQKDKNLKKEMVLYYQLSIKEILSIKRGEDFINRDGITVPNKQLTHPSPVPRSYAYCSDTAFCPDIAGYISECDLIYHESTFAENLKDIARETGHSTAKQAAEIAKMAGAKKLLLGHFSSRYKDLSVFEAEAREVFGNSHIVNEGETYHIELSYQNQ